MDTYELLNCKLEEADLILIGIGSSFQYDWHLIGCDATYSKFVEEVEESTEYDQFLSFLQYYILKNKRDEKLEAAYASLASKLNGKNCFVVTTTIDDVIYDSDIDKSRIVTPCGGFRKLQCLNGCDNKLYDLENYYPEKVVKEAYESGILPENYHIAKCPACGCELTFNQIGNGRYIEAGYLEQWQQYKIWLMGTMHRKVLILELGAGLEFPTVIRSPFEKMISYNESASFFRIHPSMSQLFMADEVKERAFGIEMDVKDFLLGWK